VLTCLANDVGISTRIPDLAQRVLDMHRAHYRAELLKLAVDGSLASVSLPAP
jgi:hypothetical protein